MSDRLVSRYRLPHVKGQPSQAKAAAKALERLTADANERAVLRVIVDHADGAGVCFLTVERITELAGIGCKRTVQRTRARLEAKELLERIPSLRQPTKYDAIPSLLSFMLMVGSLRLAPRSMLRISAPDLVRSLMRRWVSVKSL